MALDTFAAKTFADDTFAGGTFTGASTGTYLQTFRANTFANRTFTGGTFQGEGAVDPDQLQPPVVDANCTPSHTTTLDFSRDHLVWDNYDEVTYVSVRNSGDVAYCVERCHIHSITQKELAASDGVYVPTDVTLRVPAINLPTLPKPRDRWQDVNGTIWTVLESGRIVTRSRHRLVSRDLILHHDLRDQITIQTPVVTYDAAGVKLKAWQTLYAGLASRVQPITADIVDERGVRGLRVTHQVTVGQELSVTNEDRISFGGKYYEIRGYHNPERIDELPVLDAELVP